MHLHLTPMLLGAAGIAVLSMSTVTMSLPTYAECASCHGDFNGGTSPGGSIFPGDSKHTMHRNASYMATDCFLCHQTIGDTPITYLSRGTENNPGIGCTGCHEPFGLRAHHTAAGVIICMGCHPEDPPPPPEGTLPVYYGTVDTRVDDPCGASGLEPLTAGQEVWTLGDTHGLDNDGDNLYDEEDPDCGACPADLTGPGDVPDGNVDALDFLLLISQWGSPCVGSCEADITGATPLVPDGNVDSLDFLLLIGQWGNPGNC